MGFEMQMHEILHRLPETRQTVLFSATLPKALAEFAKAGLHDPTLIRLDVDTKTSEDLEVGARAPSLLLGITARDAGRSHARAQHQRHGRGRTRTRSWPFSPSRPRAKWPSCCSCSAR